MTPWLGQMQWAGLALLFACGASANSDGPVLRSRDIEQQAGKLETKLEERAVPLEKAIEAARRGEGGQAKLQAQLAAWPWESQRVAQEMMRTHGAPDAVTEEMLLWRDRGPWRRIVVHKEGNAHRFPSPHMDVLEQVVAYAVPEERLDELARYNGSVTAHRTAGELSVRCDTQAHTILALNLAHAVLQNEKSAEEARADHHSAIQQEGSGASSALLSALQFAPQRGTADPDRAVRVGR